MPATPAWPRWTTRRPRSTRRSSRSGTTRTPTCPPTPPKRTTRPSRKRSTRSSQRSRPRRSRRQLPTSPAATMSSTPRRRRTSTSSTSRSSTTPTRTSSRRGSPRWPTAGQRADAGEGRRGPPGRRCLRSGARGRAHDEAADRNRKGTPTMRAMTGSTRTIWIMAVTAVVSLAAGLGLSHFIVSPSEAAANAAPPPAGPITVPVEQRTLANDVVMRGDAIYEDPAQGTIETGDIGGLDGHLYRVLVERVAAHDHVVRQCALLHRDGDRSGRRWRRVRGRLGGGDDEMAQAKAGRQADHGRDGHDPDRAGRARDGPHGWRSFRFVGGASFCVTRRPPPGSALLRRQRRPGGPRRPSPASARCPAVGHRGGPRLELRLVGVVELLLVLEVDVRLRLGVLEAVAAGEVGNCRLDLLGGDRRDLRVDLFLDGRVVLFGGVRRHVGVRVVPDRLDLRVDLVLRVAHLGQAGVPGVARAGRPAGLDLRQPRVGDGGLVHGVHLVHQGGVLAVLVAHGVGVHLVLGEALAPGLLPFPLVLLALDVLLVVLRAVERQVVGLLLGRGHRLDVRLVGVDELLLGINGRLLLVAVGVRGDAVTPFLGELQGAPRDLRLIGGDHAGVHRAVVDGGVLEALLAHAP